MAIDAAWFGGKEDIAGIQSGAQKAGRAECCRLVRIVRVAEVIEGVKLEDKLSDKQQSGDPKLVLALGGGMSE